MIFGLNNPSVDKGITPHFDLDRRDNIVRCQWTKEIWSLFWTSYLTHLFMYNEDGFINDVDNTNLKDIIDLFYDDIRQGGYPDFKTIYNRLMEHSSVNEMAQLYFNKTY